MLFKGKGPNMTIPHALLLDINGDVNITMDTQLNTNKCDINATYINTTS
jgi:hypothetical protein